jgi:nucleoside-diphosphate-sugar epimerase
LKVLITGAAGRVGSSIADLLHAEGVDLRLTDRKVRKGFPVRTEVLNLLDRDGVYRLLEGIDAVIHLGNHPFFSHGGDAQQVFVENCAMNMNVFQAAIEHGVRKIVFFSSIQVVNGDRHLHDDESKTPPSQLKYLPVDSDSPANPRNPYSLSKRCGEVLLEHYTAPAGISSIAIRLPWTCQSEWWNWMQNQIGKRLRPHTLLDEAFIYLHAEDAARLVLAVLRTDLPGFRIYHPGAATTMCGLSPTELIARFYQGVELRKPAHEMTSLVDITRITRETGWLPQLALTPIDPAANNATQVKTEAVVVR